MARSPSFSLASRTLSKNNIDAVGDICTTGDYKIMFMDPSNVTK